MLTSHMTQRVGRALAKSDGNVTMFFALSLPVLALAVAMGIDYTNATIVKSKLNSAADAAALAALTPAMLQASDATAKAAAYAMFDARAAAIGSLVASQTSRKVNITHPPSNTSIRLVEVDYSVQSSTIFSGILHTASMGIGGSSTAQASVPPNIDFYLLLDNSPSMALPATQTDLTNMQNATPSQDQNLGVGYSCAFACHQASTNNGDTMGNPCIDGSTPPNYSNPTLTYTYSQNGTTYNIANQLCDASKGLTQIDNYALARKKNITLRLDELSAGVTTLMNTAYKYQTSGIWAAPPTYTFTAYSMDSLWSIGAANNSSANNLLMAKTTSYQSGWSAAAANFGVMEMWANNQTCSDAACDGAGSNGDVATNYDNAMSDIYAKMPAPGNGTNLSGDTPKGVLFFVTDGVEDEENVNRLIQPINSGATTNYCDKIKAQNIKIAILYTEYLPVPSNPFYVSNVQYFQTNIGPQLRACASEGLFYDAAIGADLGAALSQLFQSVVQSAALSN